MERIEDKNQNNLNKFRSRLVYFAQGKRSLCLIKMIFSVLFKEKKRKNCWMLLIFDSQNYAMKKI